jgi:hypothetical protein
MAMGIEVVRIEVKDLAWVREPSDASSPPPVPLFATPVELELLLDHSRIAPLTRFLASERRPGLVSSLVIGRPEGGFDKLAVTVEVMFLHQVDEDRQDELTEEDPE